MQSECTLTHIPTARQPRTDPQQIYVRNQQQSTLIARQRPQYTHATIEAALQEMFSVWVRAMPLTKQRLRKHF
jgi:hypothetical protein